MSALSFLKTPFARPPQLMAGTVFAISTRARFPEEDCQWRVCAIRQTAGHPHAVIEQLSTGVTKTIAVSALTSDRSFQIVRSDDAQAA